MEIERRPGAGSPSAPLRLVIYRRVRLSTFGRVRSAGFALLASFDDPIPNPGRRAEG
ncbi:MAG TPA: hypothetical protein PLV93_03845 [Microthrixaceae bacterium]|nr:hypothetical protein [Microthrixaceae bacterium]HNI34505.1 hypothetical protein [Microthrixaceae bacterium]